MVLTGLDADCMDLLIDWVYGGFKPRIAYEQRLSLFHASHKFHIHELLSECKRALRSSVNSETYPLLADLAQKFKCHELEHVGSQHLVLVHVFLMRSANKQGDM